MISRLSISKNIIYFLPIGILLILIAGFRPIGIDGDSLAYAGALVFEINFIDKEPAFWIINEFNKYIFGGNEQTFFLIFAILGVWLKLIAINKYSSNVILSVFVYISFFFILQEMTQIRAGIAIAIFIIALNDIVEKDFRKFSFKILLASLFHYSAIFFIFFYFINHKKLSKVFYALLPIFGIVVMHYDLMNQFIFNIAQFLPSFISEKIFIYYELQKLNKLDIINPINLGNFLLLLVLYFNILFVDESKYSIIFIKMLSIGFFILFTFSFIEVFAYRLANYMFFSIVFLIPYIVTKFKQELFLWILISIYLLYSLFKNIFVLLNI